MSFSPYDPQGVDSRITLEVCVDSVESAFAAVRGGADRLEICGNLSYGGGSTPSIGLVKAIKKACPDYVETMAMVRPRVGDFVYSPEEINVMNEDICAFAELGLTGVVLGVLQADGGIDVPKTQMLADSAVAQGLQVCFHRAFDMTSDLREALLSISRSIPGVTRILTSGGLPTAPPALPILTELIQITHEEGNKTHRIPFEIMPGSGLNDKTVRPLLHALIPLGLRSIHMSGGEWVSGYMRFRKAGMAMGAGGPAPGGGTVSPLAEDAIGNESESSLKEWGKWQTSMHAIRAVREVADEEMKLFIKSRSHRDNYM